MTNCANIIFTYYLNYFKLYLSKFKMEESKKSEKKTTL